MLRTWCMKNTFISKIIPHCNNYLNNNYILKKTFKQPQNVKLKLFKITNQRETIYHDYYKLSDFKVNINITEQDHIYPKPYFLISNNFIHSTLHISNKNKNIIEMYNIKFNYPDDFSATVHYLLIINNNVVKKHSFSGFDKDYFSNGLKQNHDIMVLLNSFSSKLNKN